MQIIGYIPQKIFWFQLTDGEEAPWCPCNDGTQGHQHKLLWSCHPSHPVVEIIIKQNLFKVLLIGDKTIQIVWCPEASEL